MKGAVLPDYMFDESHLMILKISTGLILGGFVGLPIHYGLGVGLGSGLTVYCSCIGKLFSHSLQSLVPMRIHSRQEPIKKEWVTI